MESLFDKLFYSYFGGVALIVVGLWFVRHMIQGAEYFSIHARRVYGWAAAIGFIGLGSSIIILKLIGKI